MLTLFGAPGVVIRDPDPVNLMCDRVPCFEESEKVKPEEGDHYVCFTAPLQLV